MISADDALQLFAGKGTAPARGPMGAVPMATTPQTMPAPASAGDAASSSIPSMLHKDMTANQALAAMGVDFSGPAASSSTENKSSPSIIADVAKSIPAGLETGIENVPMIPAQVGNLAFRYGIIEPGLALGDLIGNSASKDTRARLRSIQPLPNTPEQAGARLVMAGHNVFSSNENDLSAQDAKKIEQNVPSIGEIIHTPETTAGQYANTISQFVGGGLTAGIKPGAPPEGTPPSLWQTVKSEAKNAAPLVAAGIGSESGGQIFQGTPLEESARIIGGLIGGSAYGIGRAGAEKARSTIRDNAEPMGFGQKEEIIPAQNGNPALMATEAQQRLAGQKILESARNPDQVKQTLGQFDERIPGQGEVPAGVIPDNIKLGAVSAPAQQLEPGQIIPGSKPTLAETTLDPGLVQWQDALRSKNRDTFLSRAADQNAARNQQISNVGGKGNPEAIGTFFGNQLKSLDEQTNAAINNASSNLMEKTDMLGGRDTPQQYGQGIREQIENSRAAVKQNENALWNVLKPYNEVKINGERTVKTARELVDSVDANAGQALTPSESTIFGAVSNWTEHPDFGRLKKLRTSITDAQREIRTQYGSESQPMRRMSMMKQAVDETINDAVTGISHVENHAIDAGHLAPENSLHAKMQQMVEQFYADRKANAAGGSPFEGPLSYATGDRPSTVSGVGGTASNPFERSGGVARDQGIQETSGIAPSSFNEAGQQAYQAAREATFEKKQTFGNGVVGKVLKPGRGGAEYAVADSSVANSFFNSRDVSKESINAYSKAVGGKVEAMNLLQDAAASDLRSKAINQDGTINPQAFNRWVKSHQKAIEAFPELKTGLENTKAAQEFLNQKLAERKSALDDFNKSRAAKFVDDDPIIAVRKAFNSDNSNAAFTDLVKRVRGDQAATEGLKRAAADYLLQEIRGAEKGDTVSLDLRDPKAFRKFVDKHNGALKTLFGGQGVNNLERVVADMRRSSIVTKGAKLPGQSNTTQDAINAAKQSTPARTTVLGRIAGEVANHAITGGAIIGEMAGGHPIVGAATAIGAKLMNTMRSAGIKTIDQLQLEAALNPQLANELVKKASAEKIPMPIQNRIGAILLKTIPIAASHRVTTENEE